MEQRTRVVLLWRGESHFGLPSSSCMYHNYTTYSPSKQVKQLGCPGGQSPTFSFPYRSIPNFPENQQPKILLTVDVPQS